MAIVEISNKGYRKLACYQSYGHYAGKVYPRIVILQNMHMTVIIDGDAGGRATIRPAEASDYYCAPFVVVPK